MATSNSSKVWGTSRETTRSVTAKAKTASEKPWRRETSPPRQEKPSSSPARLRTNLSRSISPRHLMATAKILTSLPDDTAATALSAQAIARPSGYDRESFGVAGHSTRSPPPISSLVKPYGRGGHLGA